MTQRRSAWPSRLLAAAGMGAALVVAGCETPSEEPAAPPAITAPDLAATRPPVRGGKAATGAGVATTAKPKPTRPGEHRVQAGETVYDIANRYGLDTYTVISANRLAPPFELTEGQVLRLPRGVVATGDGSRGAAPPPPVARGGESPSAAGDGTVESLPPAGKPANPLGNPEVALGPRLPPAAGEAPFEDGGGFLWPVSGEVISSFGPKGQGMFNDGINIAAKRGTPVRATQAGEVVYAGNELRGFGNMVLIKHAGGWTSAYAHNDELLVRKGERVRRGQVIARVGSSGSVSDPQLHFELRKGKDAVNPVRYLRRPVSGA